MAAREDHLAPSRAIRPSEDELIGLLRSLRAGAAIRIVHRADVYSAAPADLVANLEPVPGTGQGDGKTRVWLFLCAKKYKSTHAKPGGRRQRAIAADEACWHSEIKPQVVKGPDSTCVGTVCKLSYGCKTAAPAKFVRLGWCMTEYTTLGDKKQDGAADDGDYVLCKVYRSPRAKGESSSCTSASSAMATEGSLLPSSGSKRKAAGDHHKARPAKLSNDQAVQETLLIHDATKMPVQVQDGADQGFYQFYGYEGCQSGGNQQLGVQHSLAEVEQNDDAGEFVQTAYGSLASLVAGVTVDGLLGPETSGELRTTSPPLDADFFDGLPF